MNSLYRLGWNYATTVWFEITSLAPLGERVARNRRFHQSGREGGTTFCLLWG